MKRKLYCILALFIVINFIGFFSTIAMFQQEVNLANNQLAELPELWVTMWGAPDPATGLLVVSSTSGSNAGAAAGKGVAGVKVLVLGNPLLTV